jgi:FkbM family methyltransferase
MGDRLRTVGGVLRSLRIYYGSPRRRAAMVRLYSQFVSTGDLVFDVGAHVGDRTAAFRRLGARVVAVEPQPALLPVLKFFHGRDKAVAIEPIAVGRAQGTVTLRLNIKNPTVSTASDEFVRAAAGAPGWNHQTWTRAVDVPLTTLDTLIVRHGTPAFIKIDVEGFEAEALAGLSRPVPALSFEFTTIQRSVAATAVERCAALGYTAFNAALGESQTFEHPHPIGAAEITRWIEALPHAANSGDVYAMLSS